MSRLKELKLSLKKSIEERRKASNKHNLERIKRADDAIAIIQYAIEIEVKQLKQTTK